MNMKYTLLFLFSFFTSIVTADELVNLSAKQLTELQKNQNALVINIRTEKEWESTGTIPGSHKLQFFSPIGKYDIDKWMADLNQLKSDVDQPIILVCRSGGRSGKLGNMLVKKLKLKNIHHLSSGMSSWVRAGNKTIKDCLNKLACK